MSVLYIVIPVVAIIILIAFIFVIFRKHEIADFSAVLEDFEVLEILVPREGSITTDEGSTNSSSYAADHLFSSLHGLLKEDHALQEHFSFEIKADVQGTKFYVVAPKTILRFVESQVYAQYPNAKMQISKDYADVAHFQNKVVRSAHVSFVKEEFFPIKIFKDFEVDPLSNIMATLAEIKGDDSIWIQYLVKPIPDGWQEDGRDYLDEMIEGKSKRSKGPNPVKELLLQFVDELINIISEIPVALLRGPTHIDQKSSPAGKSDDKPPKLNQFQELEVNLIQNKLVKMGFEVVIRLVCASGTEERVQANFRSLSASFKQYSTSSSNELYFEDYENPLDSVKHYSERYFDVGNSLILNSEELATLFHMPSSREEAPSVSWVYSKQGEPPSGLPQEDCTYLGKTVYRGREIKFGMQNGDDRLRHMYLIGKTGAGKSTLLKLMIIQDILNGNGVGVLDPHGETIEEIMEKIPEDRADDVVLFDPSDAERPVGLNLLQIDDPSQKNLLASALLSAIKQHFDFSWGPRLEYLLNYSLLTLLDVPGTSMLGITRLLEDKNYRNYILHQVKDPVVMRFWEQEFKEMQGNQRLITEAVAPIQNKVNRFLSSSTIRNILAQKSSTIDIWEIMQNKKILLMNLSKGKIGSDNANLLGALLVSRIQFMALQRAKIPPKERVPFYLYVDEFQNFATGSFEEILSESRKYKLGLYMTHQYTAQLPEYLMKAVFGNVGTIATFSLGAPDARELAHEFAPYFDAEDIISLERFHIYIKMMVDGMTTLPFSAKILLPWEENQMMPDTHLKDRIIEQSRQKYGSDREYVEDIISRWTNRPFDKGMAIAEEHKKNKE